MLDSDRDLQTMVREQTRTTAPMASINTHPNQIFRHPRRHSFLFCQLRMCRRRRMDHERLGVPHVREVARQFELVDDAACHVEISLDAKAQHATKRVWPQQPLCFFVVLVVGQSGIRYPYDLGVFLEPSTIDVQSR